MTTTTITDGAALYRLMAWLSPAYPVGAYTYSHGLETAVEDGAVREEREIGITADQFGALWPATVGKRLTKIRYKLPSDRLTIEVDIYEGIHRGLTVAEVEFPDRHACEKFQPPDWFGEEVTNNPRYSNVVLARE